MIPSVHVQNHFDILCTFCNAAFVYFWNFGLIFNIFKFANHGFRNRVKIKSTQFSIFRIQVKLKQ